MSFNKTQANAPKSEKNKIIMCGVLGAVLVGMGAFHFLKGSPQAADASGGDAAPVAVPQQTPEEARAALQADPTAGLLLKSSNTDDSLNQTPNNPFLMAQAWRTNLVHTTPMQHTTHVVETTTPTGPVLSLTADQFKLTGIFRQGQKLFAIINGQIVTTGGVVGDGRITEIKLDHVALQHVDSPEGPHLVLTIDPQLK